MAMVSVPGGIWAPMPMTYVAYTSLLMDASAEKVAICFDAPIAGTLDGFGFLLRTVTQAPVNGLNCSFQGIAGANGDPDGVADQFRVVTAGLTTNTWVETGLVTSTGADGGVKRTVTKGQRLSAVIGFESFAASDSLNIATLTTIATNVEALGRCFPAHFTAAWAKQTTAPVFALKYATTGYVPVRGAYPFSALNATNFNTGSSPDERGNIITVPFGVQVTGAWVYVNPLVAGRDFTVILYDVDGATPLATATTDADWWQNVAAARTGFIPFTSDVTLVQDSAYRLTIRPDTGGNSTAQDFEVSTAAHMNAAPWGTLISHVERTDAGAWSPTTTKRTLCGLVISAVDIPSGGGHGSWTTWCRNPGPFCERS